MNHISVCRLFHIACKLLRWADPLLAQMALVLSSTVHNGVSQTRGTSGELKELPRARSLWGSDWQDLGRARSNSEQVTPKRQSLREHYQSGQGMAWQSVHAGRAQKPCKLNQEAVASTWQKATASLSSAPGMTDAAAHDAPRNMLTLRSQLQGVLCRREGWAHPWGGAPR